MKPDIFIQTETNKNIRKAVGRLLEAPPGSPRIGLFIGPVGRGKTWAVDRLAVETGAAYVSAARVWTPNSMLRDILDAIGEAKAWGAAECLKLAAAGLQTRMPHASMGKGLLIVDEGDYLAKGVRAPDTPKLLDTIRDLHDRSGAPILLVGMDDLARTLAQFKQFQDRVVVVEEAKPIGAAEATELAAQACGLELSPEVAQALVRATEGNLRRLTNYLDRLERMARAGGKKPEAAWVAHVEKRVNAERRRMAGLGVRKAA